jgi:DNA-binding Lrp family transcriptional regulator
LGTSYAEIADAVDVSKGTVHNDVKRLREQWRKETTEDMDRHMSRRLAELKAIKREAYAAWLESREGPAKKKVQTKEGGGDPDEVTREVTRTSGGDAQHLRAMLNAETRIQKLLGLHDHDPEKEGSHIKEMVDVIEETAKEVDMSQFEDEEIK